MKATRFFFTFFLMFCALGSFAQDSYRETLSKYINVNPNMQSFSSDKMRIALQQFNSVILGDMEKEKVEELTNRYLDKQMMNDIIDMLMPIMQEHLTETDLKDLTILLSSPEAKSFTTHNMAWTDAIVTSLQDNLKDAYKKISSGLTPSPVKISDSIDKNFVNKMTQLIEISDTHNQFMREFELGAAQLPAELTTWVKDNINNMLINNSAGILTEKDIDTGINLYQMPTFKKTLDAVSSITDDPVTFGLSFLSKYQDWLKKQGVEAGGLGF